MSASQPVLKVGLLAVAACLLISCASPVRTQTANDHAFEGIPYFLPRGYLHIVATESDKSPGTEYTIEEKSYKEDVVPDANNKDSKVKTEGWEKTTSYKKSGPKGSTNRTLTLTITPVIDPDHRWGVFYADYSSNAFYDDVIKLKANQDQMLETVSVETTDQTGAAIINLVKTAANLAQIGQYKIQRTGIRETGSDDPPELLKLDVVINPFDPAEREAVRKVFKTAGYDFTIDPGVAKGEIIDNNSAEENLFPKGLVFKSPVAIQVRLGEFAEEQGNAGGDSKQSFGTSTIKKLSASSRIERHMFILPSDDRIFVAEQKRGFLTKRTNTLTITNGMLYGVDINKPSEVLAFTGLPLAVSQEILSGLKGIITVEVEQAQNQTALLEQQLKQIETSQKIKAAQEAEAAAPASP